MKIKNLADHHEHLVELINLLNYQERLKIEVARMGGLNETYRLALKTSSNVMNMYLNTFDKEFEKAIRAKFSVDYLC